MVGRRHRIVCITLHVIMRKTQRMILVEIVVDTDIRGLILIPRIDKGIGVAAETVLIFGITAHLAAQPNKVFETVLIETACIAEFIVMTMPRARRNVECPLRLIDTFTRDNVDDATRCV